MTDIKIDALSVTEETELTTVNEKGEVITYGYKLETLGGIKISIKSPNNLPLTQGQDNLVLKLTNPQTTLDVKVKKEAEPEPKTPELVAGKEKGEKTVKPKASKAIEEMAEQRKKEDADTKAAVKELDTLLAEAEKLGVPEYKKMTKAALEAEIKKRTEKK